jgi:tRNA threonylcarbamoyladenosine biosynthesis protein TsaB
VIPDRAVVGFDTATPDVTVALTQGGEALAEESIPPGQGGRPQAATALLPAIHRCVEEAGGWAAVDLIGVGIGPGSFTGLRIGVSTARALAQGLGKPIAPVVSLEALALGVGDRDPERPRAAVIDARRGQVFAALYDAGAEQRRPPFVATPEEAAERLGKEADSPIAVGDGAVRFRRMFEAAGLEVPADRDETHHLRARELCVLAKSRGATRLEAVEPIYLRRPDAELWRERQRTPQGS